MLQSRVDSRPCPQTIDYARKGCQGQTLTYYDIHFHPSLIFAGKARSLPLEWIPYRTPLWKPTRVVALFANIRLGWEWMAATNTLAYYDTAAIMAVNLFIAQESRTSINKRFNAVIYTAV